MPTAPSKSWHALPAERVAQELDSRLDDGLASEQATQRLEEYGPNAITQRKGTGPLLRFLLQFHQPLIYILLVASGITLLLQEWVDSAVILGVVVANAAVGFIQEAKAVRAIEALSKAMTTAAVAVRDGRKKRIQADQLVPGDLVLLQSGDKVPADVRLVRGRELQVDESALTGESVPVHKQIDPVAESTPMTDRGNMAYASTLVTYGQGAGLVVATGDRTEIGRISELVSTAEQLATPLTRQIARFSRMLLVAIIALAAVTFAFGVIQGEDWPTMFVAAIALAVAAIPEGLPAAVTIMLAIGVSRMAKRKAIIRKLPAVETLGGTDIICSDKTGTLTKNQMTVLAVVAGGRRYAVSGTGYDPEGRIAEEGAEARRHGGTEGEAEMSGGGGRTEEETGRGSDQRQESAPPASGLEPQASSALIECLRAGALCNDSLLVHSDGRWEVEGDPTEGALLAAARKAGMHADELEKGLQRLDSVPFESHHQYMATLHDAGSGEPRVVYVKGSVERLLSMCESMLGPDGQETDLDERAIHEWQRRLASEGLRVLAFARGEKPPGSKTLDHEDIRRGLSFLGLQAMIDPPRPEAIEAVEKCHRAHVRVKMITGDHAVTAGAIARQLGLGGSDGATERRSDEEAQGREGRSETAPQASSLESQPSSLKPDDSLEVITGAELRELEGESLADAAERAHVFARMAPEQKLRLVKALQSRNHVVAMTGDGVNDAPALRQADIGVAMGLAGTEAAKEASDMVLTDDNFASIEAAVEEGRSVFDNLMKFIVWILPTNAGQGLVILTAVILGTTLPLLPVQVLWLNMTTALTLGLTLAFEPKEPGIMTRPPRDPTVPILTGPLVMRILFVSSMLLAGSFGLFQWELWRGSSVEQARTVAAGVFVAGQMLYLFNCRSLTRSMWSIGPLTNPWLAVGVGAMLLLQTAFTYAPPMNLLFNTEPIPASSWAAIAGVGVFIYTAVGFEKWIRRGRSGGRVGAV